MAALWLYLRRRRRDITLTYLDAKGSAEATRLALHIGRVPFRDERLSYAEVALLRDELPFGQVPTIRVGQSDEVYCQSAAILRYAGRCAGLVPSDPESQLRCEMVLECIAEIGRDLLPLWYKSVLRRDPTTGAPGVTLTQAQVQKVAMLSTSYMPLISAAGENTEERTYFCGERTVIADLAFYVDATQIAEGRSWRCRVGPAVLLIVENLRAPSGRNATTSPRITAKRRLVFWRHRCVACRRRNCLIRCRRSFGATPAGLVARTPPARAPRRRAPLAFRRRAPRGPRGTECLDEEHADARTSTNRASPAPCASRGGRRRRPTASDHVRGHREQV